MLYYDNFSQGFDPASPSSPYDFISLSGAVSFTSNDGVATTRNNELTITSVPFTFTFPFMIDGIKYVVQSRDLFNIPVDGEFVVETIMSAEQTGLKGLPGNLQASPGSLDGVNNANVDPRLAAAIFGLGDTAQQISFTFLLTNEIIYAFYTLNPYNMTAYGGPVANYHSWGNTIPLAARDGSNPLGDFVKLAVAYNYRENYVRWIINDIEAYRINRIGFPLERKFRTFDVNGTGGAPFPDTLIRSSQVGFAFGTSSIMDLYNPINPGQIPNSGLVNLNSPFMVDPIVTDPFGGSIPATYVSPYNGPGLTGTLFGQGLIMKMKYIATYILAREKELRTFPDLCCYKSKLLLSRCQQDAIPNVNSSDSLFYTKCKGYIKNCDDCAPQTELCSCSSCKKQPIPKQKHTCPTYTPHSVPQASVKRNLHKLQ